MLRITCSVCAVMSPLDERARRGIDGNLTGDEEEVAGADGRGVGPIGLAARQARRRACRTSGGLA